MRRLATVLLFTAVLCGGIGVAAQAATAAGPGQPAHGSARASATAANSHVQSAPSGRSQAVEKFKPHRHVSKSKSHSRHHSRSHKSKLPGWVKYVLIPLLVIAIVGFMLFQKSRRS